jgi:hypothetical protein
MRVFSFCIYGTDPKYYLGLQENIRIIREYFPEYKVYVYCGASCNRDFLQILQDPDQKSPMIHFVDTGREGPINTIYRYYPIIIDGVDTVVIRDADSEINERDRWCIHDFIEKECAPEYYMQIIRDHFWHKSRIMGGLSLFKNVAPEVKIIFQQVFAELESSDGISMKYGVDEAMLDKYVYPVVKDHKLVYSNISVFESEIRRSIDCPNDNVNFCGNVVLYHGGDLEKHTYESKTHQFMYNDYPLLKQIEWLREQTQLDLILTVVEEYGFDRIAYGDQAKVIFYMIASHIHRNTRESMLECMKLYGLFYKYDIKDDIKNQLESFFAMVRGLGYVLIGTCDPEYEPGENEFAVCFGNYPDDYMCLPQGFTMYQNFHFYGATPRLEVFKSHSCWSKIDRIFIMTLENEHERLHDTIMQLCAMHAPLDRVEVYRGKKQDTKDDRYLGATQNHMDCLKTMMDKGYETCLFLEDDFMFTSRTRDNRCKLEEFFKLGYEYTICFLSASKHHRREDYDDLLIRSKQYCTTSAGYLVDKSHVALVYNTVKEGYDALQRNLALSHVYCIDRYWSKLDGLFIFKEKLGYQKPAMSKIHGNLNLELD